MLRISSVLKHSTQGAAFTASSLVLNWIIGEFYSYFIVTMTPTDLGNYQSIAIF